MNIKAGKVWDLNGCVPWDDIFFRHPIGILFLEVILLAAAVLEPYLGVVLLAAAAKLH